MNGNITESFEKNDNKWCCQNSLEHCVEDGFFDVKCTGKAISLQEQCSSQQNGHGCNDYRDDQYRNYRAARSYINLCNDRYLHMYEMSSHLFSFLIVSKAKIFFKNL